MVRLFMEHLPTYKIFQTNQPAQASRIVKQVLPDLVITDWDMPEISGIELIRTLKLDKQTRDIPVIMATGVMLSTKHLQVALDAGAVDYIRKPIEPTELVSRTKAALLINSYYKQIVKQKDQELTENSVYLVKNTEHINHFTEELEKLEELIVSDPALAQQQLAALREELARFNLNDSWHRFNTSFTKVHSDFTKNLTTRFPSLTPTEIKLCSFVRLSMSNKEIAAVLHLSPDSVKVSRYRLRKKLELKSGSNLESFLTQF